jgi:Tfp pilus tip-associated adhesin PilY1
MLCRYLKGFEKALGACFALAMGLATATTAWADPPFVDLPIGTYTKDEDDGPATIGLDSVFKDPEGDPMVYSIVSNDRPDIVALSIVGVPPKDLLMAFVPNENGIANVRVSATDTELNTTVHVFQIEVRPRNDSPVVVGVTPVPVSIAEDSGVTAVDLSAVIEDIDLLFGDEPESLTYTVQGGYDTSLVDSATTSGATLEITPVADRSGSTLISLKVEDLKGDTTGFDVALTVLPVNDPPTVAAAPVGASFPEDSGPQSVSLAGVFTDVDGDPLTLSITGITNAPLYAVGGAPSVAGSNVTFTSAANAFGASTITVRAQDAGGAFVTTTLGITITPVNDAPTVAAAPAPASFPEDSGAQSVSLAGVFTDIDGDPLTLSVVGATNPGLYAAGGAPVVSGTNVNFTSAANVNGASTITVRAQDAGGAFVDATIDLTITPVNDPPVVAAAPAGVTFPEDSGPHNVSLAGVFSDIDGDPLTLSVPGATNAGLFAAGGAPAIAGVDLTFTSATDANGSSTVTLRAQDGSGEFVETTFSITIDPVNDAPTENAPVGPFTYAEDSGSHSEDLSAVFGDVDGDPLTLTVTSVTNAALFAGTGQPTMSGASLGFTLAADQNGAATITVAVDDGNGGTATTTVTVNVTAVNDTPTVAAPPAPVTVTEDAAPFAIDFAAVFTDIDGDALTLSVVSFTNAPLFAVPPTIAGSSVSVTLAAEANGASTITVQADDGNGGTVTADVALTVTPQNDAPTENAPVGPFTYAEDSGGHSEDLSGVFGDADGDPLTLTVTSVTNAALFAGTGQPTMSGTNLGLTLAADQNGAATITVQADDGNGGSATTTVTVNVTAVNDTPTVAAAPAPVTVAEDAAPFAIDFAAVFTDIDGDALTLSVVSFTNAPLFAVPPTIAGASVSVTLAPDQNGTSTITVQAEDPSGATVTADVVLTVTAENDAPTEDAPVGPFTYAEDSGSHSEDLSGVFGDADGDPLTYAVTSVTNAALFAGTGQPTMSGASLGFTLAADQNGAATITVAVDDGNGGSATTTVTVNVTAVNDTPTVAAPPAPVTVAEDAAPFAIDFAAVFTDIDGDALMLSVVGVTNPGLFAVAPAIAGTSVNVTLAPDQNGTSTITVRAEDAGGLFVTASVDLTVTPGNDAPTVVGVAGPVTVDEDASPTTVDLSGVFADIDAGDTLTLDVLSVTNPGLFATPPTITGTTLNLVFAANQNGTSGVSFRATDSAGASVNSALTVTVNPVNDTPTVVNPIPDQIMFEDGAPLTISIVNVFADVDIGTDADNLTYAVNGNTNASLVTVTLVGTDLTLTLAPDQNGSATITVRATDTFGATVDDSFDLTVTPVSDDPVAVNDTATMAEDDPAITIAVLANDYLAEQPTTITAAGATITIAGVDYPNSSESAPTTVVDPFGNAVTRPNGTVTIQAGTIVYEPKVDFHGTDTFTYVITDSEGDSATGTVTVTVTPLNDPPIGIQERSFSIVENSVLTVLAGDGVLQGAYDVDGKLLDGSGNEVGGQTLAVVIDSLPINGVLALDNATGAFTYTPLVNFVGEDQFTYRISDGSALSPTPAYVVRVVVVSLPPPAPPPPPGEVAINYNLSNTPLEQQTGVPSNVLVVMDDSGSMDWQTIVAGSDDGGVVVSNAGVATKSVRATSYTYLFDLATNTYPPSSSFGRILPTQAAIDADASFSGNTYGVWRGRSAKFNSIYYNPTIRYEPWIGQDITNANYANAVPTAARLDPRDPSSVINLLTPVSYTSTDVPLWRAAGGSKSVNVTNFYIPMYWATTASPPIAWNAPRMLVEIKDGLGPLAGGRFPGGSQRTDCAVDDGNPLTCTYAQELQNFANWFSYYRSREYVTKSGIGSVVARVQDIRVGYDTISATTSIAIAPMNDLPNEGNKKALLDNIYKVSSFGGTPLRQALGRAGKTFECSTGNYCPILPAPDGTCQRNYALLFTDGYWNGGAGVSGNDDIDEGGPFDGGRYEDDVKATLADTAMYYYETDLWPGLEDRVPVSGRDIAGAPPGTFDEDQPVMHQHMKTYAIAFGIEGTIDPADVPANPATPFAWTDPFDAEPHKIDDLVHSAFNGRGSYVNASDPVQLKAAFESAFLEFTQASSSVSSAAFNSTSLREGTLLYRGFFDLRDNTGDLTATRVSEDGVLDPAPLWSAADRLDSMNPVNRVVVTYDPTNREGVPFLHASLTPDQQMVLSNAQVEYLRGSRADEAPAGAYRPRPVEDGLLGDIVNSSPVFVGTPLAINRDQAPYPTDDLYSEFVTDYRNRTPVVYVGANDGMLHGFEGSTGDEVFAYVPNKIIDSSQLYRNALEELTSPFYSHKYYVDLTPRLNDVYMRPSTTAVSKSWNSILVGGLGVGGKGYFALNVTDPGTMYTSQNMAANSVLWEFTDEDDSYPLDINGNPVGGAVNALLDFNGQPVKDLGYAVTQPTLAMSNVDDGSGDKEWVAVFGNGFNSTAGIAKLFVVMMDKGMDGWDDGDVVKLTTGVGVQAPPEPRAGYPNALGTPALVDKDLNGTVDLAYAGDLLGNLYRFDLSDPDPDNWTVTRLFTATYDDGVTVERQPITKQPLVVKHPTESGFMIIFGTGSFVTKEDASNEDIQSVYGIWDRLENVPATAASDTRDLRLVEQVVTNVVEESGGVYTTRRVITKNPVSYTPEGADPGVYGWYFDFDMERASQTTSGNVNPDTGGYAPPLPQYPGEKAIRRLVFRDGTIITTTVLPATGQASCFGARPGAIMLFDVLTGGDPGRPVVDFNNDGRVTSADLVTVGGEAYAAGILFNQTDLDGALVDISTLGGEADTDFLFVSGGDETISFRIADLNDSRTGRLSWREIQETN